jgi:hypothetical protein
MAQVKPNPNSFYDPGLIVKEIHDLHAKSIRVSDTRSVVDKFYTHFRVLYTELNLPSEVSYFRGTRSHTTIIGCVADVEASLQNSYIKIYSCPDNTPFHIWFNVDNLGVPPTIPGSTPIEIPINKNEGSSVISMAVGLIINSLFKSDFSVSRSNSVVEITAVGMGEILDSSEEGTGFALVNSRGEQELASYIQIGYQDLHPVYKGQVLKNYIFNVFSGQFEIKEELPTTIQEVVWDEIATTFPLENQELYSYKYNSNLVQEMLVTYIDATKKAIVSIQKTRY